MAKAVLEETAKPVRIDITTLCPNDPNRDVILDAAIPNPPGSDPTRRYAMVLPENDMLHKEGFLTDPRDAESKHQTIVSGRPMQFKNLQRSMLWTCQTCGGEVRIEKYGRPTADS